MPYVQYYLMEIDVSVQSEVDDETAKKLQARGIALMDEPFPGIRIVPRDRSEWPDDLKELMEILPGQVTATAPAPDSTDHK
jgi:hypothetical protein